MSPSSRTVRLLLIPSALAGFVACSTPDEDVVETQSPLVQGGSDDSSTPPPDLVASSVGSVALAGMAFTDQDSGEWTTVSASGGQLTWPNPYDIDPHWIHLAWRPTGSFGAEIAKLASGDGYNFDLYLNGEKLTQGSDAGSADFVAGVVSGPTFACPAPEGCLGMVFNGSVLRAIPGVWTFELVFWKVPPSTQRVAVVLPGSRVESRSPSVVATNPTAVVGPASPAAQPILKTAVFGIVNPHPNPVSYFQAKMVPTFRHQSCSTCHSLGTPAALAAHHHGLLTEEMIGATQTSHGTQLRCDSGCHKYVIEDVMKDLAQVNFLETEWMTPGSDMDINWSAKSDQQICAKVKSNLTSAAATAQHFGADARIAWAVSSGALPALPAHPTAPPHSYEGLQHIVAVWNENGRRCP
jgi:hypothetical protein